MAKKDKEVIEDAQIVGTFFNVNEIMVTKLDGTKQPLMFNVKEMADFLFLYAENLAMDKFARELYDSEDGIVEISDEVIGYFIGKVEEFPYVYRAKVALREYLGSLQEQEK